MVQFHQSYSYEDFVQGYRPDGRGGFQLRQGVFLDFCGRAQADPDNLYAFIIDEINRGNLSKIFGELMLLIEPDKRSPEWATKLAYAPNLEEKFFVPPNLFLLGMMNTADRSLSMVDYALRRRFAFVTLRPTFESQIFRETLLDNGISSPLIDKIVSRMTELNADIARDRLNLGPGFCIGHSYFITPVSGRAPDSEWYRHVVETEIVPLLEEYRSDSSTQVAQWRDRLLSE
jgi:5-methylcytosine-specific restriction endonuclease McrBC GTP-binding regulatory subunit McrB